MSKSQISREQKPFSEPGKSHSCLDAKTDWQALATEQGVKPVVDIADLQGDFWPEHESADEFVNTIRAWRREGTQQRRLRS
jgi:hypothetical protein